MNGTEAEERGSGSVLWPVALATLVAYLLAWWFAGGLGFVNYDDPEVVAGNQVTSWSTVHRAFTETMAHAWLPLYTLSLALDRAVFGTGSAAGYHLHSFLLHALNAGLVAAIARRLGGSKALALGAGLLFGLHPALTESVVWVASRKDLLSFFFGAAATLVWLAAEQGPRRRPGLHAAGAGLLGLALLAKGSLLVLPALLGAAALGLPGDGALRRRRLLSVAPYGVIAVALTLVHLQVARLQGTMVADGPMGASAWWESAGTLGRYLSFLVLPWPASVDPAGRGVGAAFAPVLLGAVVMAVVLAKRGNRGGAALILATVAALAPFNGVFPRTTVPFAERYLYVAAAPAGMLLAAVALGLGGKGALTALLGLAALGTGLRVPAWRDSITLWESAAALPGATSLAEAKLGEALAERALEEADPERRLALFRRAADRHRRAAEGQTRAVDRLRSLQNLGLARLGAGDPEAALAALEEAGSLLAAAGDPVDSGVRAALEVNRAKALETLGREEEARAALEVVTASTPREAAPWLNLGVLRMRAGDLTGAREAIERCLALQPSLGPARLALVDVEMLSGDYSAALRTVASAAADAPRDGATLRKAGEIAALLGQPLRAEEWLRKAYDADPSDPASRRGLAGVLLGKSRSALAGGRGAESVALARQALVLDPESAQASLLLGEGLRVGGDEDGALSAWNDAVRKGAGVLARDAKASLFLARAARSRGKGDVAAARDHVEAALAETPGELRLGPELPRVSDVGLLVPAATGGERKTHRSLLLDGLLLLCEGESGAAVASLSESIGVARSAGDTAVVRAALGLRSLARRWAGDADAGVSDLQELVQRHPDDARARFLLGHALSQRSAMRRATGEGDAATGDAVAAALSLEEARRLDPTLEDAALALAELHFAEGRTVEAIRAINGVLARDPGRVEANLVLGNILKAQYMATEERAYLEEAETAFRQALAVSPDDARALAGLGSVALVGGQNREAMAFALRALDIDPRQPEARTLGALLFVRAGRARIDAYDAARGRPDGGAEEMAGAEEAVRRAQELGGETASLCVLRADILRRRKEFRAAGLELERARTLAPDDADVRDSFAAHYRDVGYALLLAGRRQEAEEAFRRAVDANPPRTDLSALRDLLERGESAGTVPGDMDPALAEEMQKQVGLAREKFGEGATHLREGRPADAAAAFRESLGHYETSHGRFALGVALDKTGDASGAEEAYRRALALDPLMADAWLNLGGILYRRGDDDGCTEAYRSFLRFRDRAQNASPETVGTVEGILRALKERKEERERNR